MKEIHRVKYNNFASLKNLVVLLLMTKFFWGVIPYRMVNSYRRSEGMWFLLQDKPFMTSTAWS